MKKEFTESKVQVLRWKYSRDEKGFVAKYSVARKPFGEFEVKFCAREDGSGVWASVESKLYGGLYWGKSFKTLDEAMKGVDGQFENIQDLAKRMEKRLEELKEHAQMVVNTAIMEAARMQNVEYEYKAKE